MTPKASQLRWSATVLSLSWVGSSVGGFVESSNTAIVGTTSIVLLLSAIQPPSQSVTALPSSTRYPWTSTETVRGESLRQVKSKVTLSLPVAKPRPWCASSRVNRAKLFSGVGPVWISTRCSAPPPVVKMPSAVSTRKRRMASLVVTAARRSRRATVDAARTALAASRSGDERVRNTVAADATSSRSCCSSASVPDASGTAAATIAGRRRCTASRTPSSAGLVVAAGKVSAILVSGARWVGTRVMRGLLRYRLVYRMAGRLQEASDTEPDSLDSCARRARRVGVGEGRSAAQLAEVHHEQHEGHRGEQGGEHHAPVLQQPGDQDGSERDGEGGQRQADQEGQQPCAGRCLDAEEEHHEQQ